MQKLIKHSKEKNRKKLIKNLNCKGKKTEELITNSIFRFFKNKEKNTKNLDYLKKGGMGEHKHIKSGLNKGNNYKTIL